MCAFDPCRRVWERVLGFRVRVQPVDSKACREVAASVCVGLGGMTAPLLQPYCYSFPFSIPPGQKGSPAKNFWMITPCLKGELEMRGTSRCHLQETRLWSGMLFGNDVSRVSRRVFRHLSSQVLHRQQRCF